MGREILVCLVVLALLFPRTSSLVLQNITLPLPLGTTNHNTPGLICTPADWTDLAGFYLFNYVAHAATVLTRPGERSHDFAATVFGSLLLPAMGLYRGMEAIFSGAAFCSNDVRKAAKSAALCFVVRRSDWRPEAGQSVGNALIKQRIRADGDKDESDVAITAENERFRLLVYQPPWILLQFGCPMYVHRQNIHGTCSLPEGYTLAIAPADAQFSTDSTHSEISSNSNLVKALIALVQTGYACLTLYRSRGDQIEQFGFAAFGLTVAPYAVMSLVNLLGNLCRPDYSCLYMVESSTMDEARSRGGVFHGTVAKVEEELGNCVSAATDRDAECLDEARFLSNDDTGPASHFTFSRATYCPPQIDEKITRTDSPDSPTSTLPISTIKPLHTSDQTHKPDDSLLLIPSCNPLKKPTSTNPSPPTYILKSTHLHKPNPYCKTKTWTTLFSLPRSYMHTHILKYALTLLISLTPLLINGLLSHFQPGTAPSNMTWKLYTMQWLGFGVVTGLCLVSDQENRDGRDRVVKWGGWKMRATFYLVSASPAVGGFVVVGQMMAGYGECRWVGG